MYCKYLGEELFSLPAAGSGRGGKRIWVLNYKKSFPKVPGTFRKLLSRYSGRPDRTIFATFCMSDDTEKLYYKLEEVLGIC